MQNTVELRLYPSIHLVFPCQVVGLGCGLEAGYNFIKFKDEKIKEALTYQ